MSLKLIKSSEEITINMLVNFRFSNFMSFDELNEFSLVKGKTKQHAHHLHTNQELDISTLKFSTIYGANGAGKSNFVKAFKFVQELVVSNKFDSEHRDFYCRSNIQNKDKFSSFEFELLIDNNIYSYGFSINIFKKQFAQEWLYKISGNHEIEYFTYNESNKDLNISIDFKDNKLLNRFSIYKDDYLSLKSSKKSLFLHFINSSKSNFDDNELDFQILNKVYNWFSNGLEVILPNKPPKRALIYLGKNDTADIENFLIDFGTGIKSVIKEDISLENIYKTDDRNYIDNILEQVLERTVNSDKKKYKGILRSNKNLFLITCSMKDDELQVSWHVFKFLLNSHTKYSLSELSDGTIRLLELYSVLTNKTMKTFVVDELDRSLHPNLTLNFLKYYLDKNNDSQLIATTHEDRILNLSILRRDEIWFVDRDDNACSKLYPLEKFKIRFDQDVMKAYLDGRYGSIPKFKFF